MKSVIHLNDQLYLIVILNDQLLTIMSVVVVMIKIITCLLQSTCLATFELNLIDEEQEFQSFFVVSTGYSISTSSSQINTLLR
jgi:hypothetical protein